MTVSLDSENWDETRMQAHRMLDDMLDHISHSRQTSAWKPLPEEVRSEFRSTMPRLPSQLEQVHQTFLDSVLPYSSGNTHPGFMGWVQGGGTHVGMLAEMLAGGLNANLGGRDHAPLQVEKQIVEWMRDLFQFPRTASGLFLTGSSLANFIGILVARNAALGLQTREDGIASAQPLTAYSSTGAHRCISQAMDMAGLGSKSLRKIGVDADFRIDLVQLEEAILRDRRAGFKPFCIVGSAGTVDVGAIDDLRRLREIADRERMWFHVDGAYAALGLLSDEIAPMLNGIELADSIAFDFHKWAQVPYDAGFLLVRDGQLHFDSFHTEADYLRRDSRGISAGSPWPCDYGPDLSRGFRALKTWMTFQVYGAERIGQIMAQSCQLAKYLAERIESEKELELLAPVALNTVCYRYRSSDADCINQEIVVKLQMGGEVAPSLTVVNGNCAIRAALFNHRTKEQDIDRLVQRSLEYGRELSRSASRNRAA